MVRYKIHYKRPTPRHDAARLVLVPVIAALLALGGWVAGCNPTEKESSWNSPQTKTTGPSYDAWMKSYLSQIQVTTSPSTTAESPSSLQSFPKKSGPSTTTSSVNSSTDLREQGNFSPRTATLPESIQPCQRSAAACFESGGLGTLMDNLDGLAIDPVTGRFCFSFQEGCRR